MKSCIVVIGDISRYFVTCALDLLHLLLTKSGYVHKGAHTKFSKWPSILHLELHLAVT
jgi:hypothetical protein